MSIAQRPEALQPTDLELRDSDVVVNHPVWVLKNSGQLRWGWLSTHVQKLAALTPSRSSVTPLQLRAFFTWHPVHFPEAGSTQSQLNLGSLEEQFVVLTVDQVSLFFKKKYFIFLC